MRRSTDVALIAVFAAMIAACAVIPGFTIGPVPFVVTIVIVLLAPLVLGAWQGMLANALYVLAGLFGLPVFAGGASGPAVLLGPTGGYLVGYILGSFVVGVLAAQVLRREVSGPRAAIGLMAAAVAGVVVIHAAGVAGLVINAGMSPSAAALTTIGFFPLDLLKAGIAGFVAVTVLHAFPRLIPAAA